MRNNWLCGKTAIITGASGGIGAAVTKLLIEKFDCKIIGIARNEERLKALQDSLKNKRDNFSYRIFDVSVRENWANFANELTRNGIVPDILINNAGFMLPFKRFENLTFEEIDEIVATDFISNLNSTKYLLPLIKQSSSPAIVNVSSAAGLCAVVGESMYCAVKFAVRGFTETLIEEYKGKIYVAGVYPGFIRTEIIKRMSVTDKENKLINKFMMPVDKAAKKIVKGLSHRKKRMVMGADGRSMSFFGRLFPKATPALVAKVLKDSGLELFSEVF